MKLDGKFTWWIRWRFFILLVVVSFLSMLYLGRMKVTTSYTHNGQIPQACHKHGGAVSTFPGDVSKSGQLSEQTQGETSNNKEPGPTFQKDDNNQPPLPIHAVNKFDPHGNDTLVLIHIQKTGGSEFLRHLLSVTRYGEHLCNVNNRSGAKPLNQKLLKQGKFTKDKHKSISSCPRDPLQPNGEQWLISERTMRWICGLHPSYTEFRSCLPKLISPRFNLNRKFHYAIFIRHPVLRYISEFLHVQRNATWATMHICHGKPVSLLDMPPCYPGYYNRTAWPNLTLSGFLSCESNWANNRQTLMLANLEDVGCFDKNCLSKEDRERILLETAKKNLKSFSFFGITEYMNESCDLFETHFGVKFPNKPHARNLSDLHSGPMLPNLWNHTLFNAILRVNSMDVELYKFALDLFLERAKEAHVVVNKDQVEQEINILKKNPLSLKSHKFKKLNYSIS